MGGANAYNKMIQDFYYKYTPGSQNFTMFFRSFAFKDKLQVVMHYCAANIRNDNSYILGINRKFRFYIQLSQIQTNNTTIYIV